MSVLGTDRSTQGYTPSSPTNSPAPAAQNAANAPSPISAQSKDGYDVAHATSTPTSAATSGAIDYGHDAPVDMKQLVGLMQSLQSMMAPATSAAGAASNESRVGSSMAGSDTPGSTGGTNWSDDTSNSAIWSTSSTTPASTGGTNWSDDTSNSAIWSDSANTTDTTNLTDDTTSTDDADSTQSLTSETTDASVDPTLTQGQSESGNDVASLYPSGTPSIRDVNQGAMGDCYAVSGMASMAATPAGQNLIQNAISKTSDSPPTYDVKMFSPDGKPITISVDGSMVNDGVRGTDNKTNWSSVLEKAYAKYNDQFDIDQSSATGYAGIANGGYAGDFLTAMTGKSSEYSGPFTSNGQSVDPSDVKQSIESSLASGKFVEATSNSSSSNSDKDVIGTTGDGTSIMGSHAYSVLGVDGDTVTLRNPWGNKGNANAGANKSDPGTITMSMQDFVKNFQNMFTSG